MSQLSRNRILTEQAVFVRRVGEEIVQQLENKQFTLPICWANWQPQDNTPRFNFDVFIKLLGEF